MHAIHANSGVKDVIIFMSYKFLCFRDEFTKGNGKKKHFTRNSRKRIEIGRVALHKLHR